MSKAIGLAAWVAFLSACTPVLPRLSAVQHEWAARERHVSAASAAPDRASRLRAEAERHDQAVRVLRAEEVIACRDVSADERARGLAVYQQLMSDVGVLRETNSKNVSVTRGASLYLRATPAMSGPRIERVLRCHAAHHAVEGEALPGDLARCPLGDEDVEVSVAPEGGGFRVVLTAREGSTIDRLAGWARP